MHDTDDDRESETSDNKTSYGPSSSLSPSEIVSQLQSYSSLHSEQSLACDHFHGDIDDPCDIIAYFCRVIADPCGVIADPCCVVTIPDAIGGHGGVADAAVPIVARLTKRCKTS